MERRVHELICALEDETVKEEFGFLLKKEASDTLYSIFQSETASVKLLDAIYYSSKKEGETDADFKCRIRMLRDTYKIYMTQPWACFRTETVQENSGIGSTSKRVQSIKKAAPLLREMSFQEISTEFLQVFTEMEATLNNKFATIFHLTTGEDGDTDEIAVSRWKRMSTGMLCKLFDQEVEGQEEVTTQVIFQNAFDGSFRFFMEFLGITIQVTPSALHGCNDLLKYDHFAVFPNERDLLIRNPPNMDPGSSPTSYSPNLIIHSIDKYPHCMTSSTTNDRDNITKLPISFIELKRGDSLKTLLDDTGNKLVIDTKGKFALLSDYLTQTVRYRMDYKSVNTYFLSQKNVTLMLSLDQCETEEEWNQTEDVLPYKDCDFLKDLEGYEKSKYAALPISYIVFNHGIATIRRADGKEVSLTIQAAIAAVLYKETNLIRLQREVETGHDIGTARIPLCSTLAKTLFLYKRFLSIPSGSTTLSQESLRITPRGPPNPDSGGGNGGGNGGGSSSGYNIRGSAGQGSSTQFSGGSSTNDDYTNKHVLFGTDGLNESSSLYTEDQPLSDPEPQSADSCELFEYNELPVNVSSIERFYNPSGPDEPPYNFIPIQYGGEYRTQVLIYTVHEILIYFPEIGKRCPALFKRQMDEKLVLKLYDRNFLDYYYEFESTDGYNTFSEFWKEMESRFDNEVRILTDLTHYNHRQSNKENPEYINVPTLVCFGMLNFEAFTLYPSDLYGHFLLLEYIESDEKYKCGDYGESIMVNEKVYNEGLEQLELLRGLKIAHNDIRPDNIIISPKDSNGTAGHKVYFIDFELGEVVEDEDVAADQKFSEDRKAFTCSVAVEQSH